MASANRIELTVRHLPILPSVLSDWWESAVISNAPSSVANVVDDVLYHTIELTRNALGCSDEVFVIAGLSAREITVVVTDVGPGMDPMFALEHSHGGGFGFRHAFNFANGFTVESVGRRYEKRRKKLCYFGDSPIRRGTRIFMSKIVSV